MVIKKIRSISTKSNQLFNIPQLNVNNIRYGEIQHQERPKTQNLKFQSADKVMVTKSNQLFTSP